MTEQKEVELRKLLGRMFTEAIYQKAGDIVVFKPTGYMELMDSLILLYTKLDERKK